MSHEQRAEVDRPLGFRARDEGEKAGGRVEGWILDLHALMLPHAHAPHHLDELQNLFVTQASVQRPSHLRNSCRLGI